MLALPPPLGGARAAPQRGGPCGAGKRRRERAARGLCRRAPGRQGSALRTLGRRGATLSPRTARGPTTERGPGASGRAAAREVRATPGCGHGPGEPFAGGGHRAGAARQCQQRPRWEGLVLPCGRGAALGHPCREGGRGPRGCSPPRFPLSPLCLSFSRRGGTARSPERPAWEHGRRPVPGVQRCPAAVSGLPPRPRGPRAGALPNDFEVPASRPHAHRALSPSPIQVAAAGGRDRGAPGPGRPRGKSCPRSRGLVRAPGSGRDTERPCQRQLVRARLSVCSCVSPGGPCQAQVLRSSLFPKNLSRLPPLGSPTLTPGRYRCRLFHGASNQKRSLRHPFPKRVQSPALEAGLDCQSHGDQGPGRTWLCHSEAGGSVLPEAEFRCSFD